MNTEHVYTSKGTQRAVYGLARYGETVRFAVIGAPAGTYIEICDDADEIARSGNGEWNRVEGLDGFVTGATALRLVNGDGQGLAITKLFLEGVSGPDAGCLGELTRMNARLATMNRDMRVCAALV